MPKRYRIVLVTAVAIILGGIVWFTFPISEPEPVYDGEPLDILILGFRSPEPDRRARAIEITGKLGTNALPTLLRMLRAYDPPGKREVMEFAREQSGYRIKFVNSSIRNCAAANACEDLGEIAKPAVPALIELLKSERFYVREAATSALKQIDPEVASRVIRD